MLHKTPPLNVRFWMLMTLTARLVALETLARVPRTLRVVTPSQPLMASVMSAVMGIPATMVSLSTQMEIATAVASPVLLVIEPIVA